MFRYTAPKNAAREQQSTQRHRAQSTSAVTHARWWSLDSSLHWSNSSRRLQHGIWPVTAGGWRLTLTSSRRRPASNRRPIGPSFRAVLNEKNIRVLKDSPA